MPKVQTIGQVLIKNALPENLKEFEGTLDKKGTQRLLERLAKENPEEYVDTLKKLSDIAAVVSTEYGGAASVDLASLRTPPSVERYKETVNAKVRSISQSSSIPMEKKSEMIVTYLRKVNQEAQKRVLNAGAEVDNIFINAINHGFRGSPTQAKQLLFGDVLNADHRGRAIPIPGLSSYAGGVSPLEYWAGAYGSRKGYADVQFATADTGYFGKQMALMGNRARITGEDCGADDVGLVRDGDDPEIIGTILSRDVGPFKKGHELEKQDLSVLRDKNVVTRSLVTCQQDEGICQKCAGKRENNEYPPMGAFVGITAARTVSEPMTQELGLCLCAATTYVTMADHSTKLLKDIKLGDYVLGADKKGNTFPTKVLNIFNQGEKEVSEIVFKGASREERSMVATLDHKILSRTRSNSKTKLDINPCGYKNSRFGAVLPSKFKDSGFTDNSYDLLLGLLLGDGGYSKGTHQVAFSCDDSTLLEDIKDYMGSLGLYLKKNSICKYMVNSLEGKDKKGWNKPNPCKQYLQKTGHWGQMSYEKYIHPEVLNSWSNVSVARLLSGLFITDGSIGFSKQSDYPTIEFCSTSERLVEQVKHLLEKRFGIYSGVVYEQDNTRGYGKRNLYRVIISRKESVSKFKNNIPLFGKKKKLLDTWNNSNLQDEAYVIKRVSMESLGKRHTMDIEVEHQDHLFVLSNGLIVSNSAKHTGGNIGKDIKEIEGFAEINQFLQVPERFIGAAILAPADGKVTKKEKAPQGGQYLYIGQDKVYIPLSRKLDVEVGDMVEAGDAMTDGTPNPAEIARHKGLGEGRKYFVHRFRKMLEDNGIPQMVRNIEPLARNFFDRVKITDPDGVGGYEIGERIPYSMLQREYTPRVDSETMSLNRSVNKYLEKPVLHYTIGTKITPKMVKSLKEIGYDKILVNAEAPGFVPDVVRLADNTSTDPDWKTRLASFGLKRSLLDSVTHGSTSKHDSASFVPSLMNPSTL